MLPGSQRGDGLFGPLIIRSPPNKNPHANLYEYDNQHMALLDWENIYDVDAMIWEYQDKPMYVPNTILVNGLGRYKKFHRNNESTFVPSTVFEVESVNIFICLNLLKIFDKKSEFIIVVLLF